MCRFMLGTHRTHWGHPGRREIKPAGPLFMSIRQLRERRTSPYPAHDTEFAVDSGGFTELHKFGGWRTTAREYADAVVKLSAETGTLLWAAIQDYMCEDSSLRATGLSVAKHQSLTIENFLELNSIAPSVRWLPVLQGREVADYLRHVDAYARAGVDLVSLPLVGLGSVCRRQAEREIVDLSSELRAGGLRLHGFGVKMQGLELSAENFVSTDSIAWSLHERMHGTGRANSQVAAEEYRVKAQATIDRRLAIVRRSLGTETWESAFDRLEMFRKVRAVASKVVSFFARNTSRAFQFVQSMAPLSKITQEALLQAAAEFDRLGREAFLKKYGFKPSNKYQAKIGSKMYDSKAIVGAAAQWTEIGHPLTHKDFSGGPARLRGVFVRNGFELIEGAK